MIQVTARIFDNSQLVGYEVQDQTGQKTQMSKLDLWMYAKNKQVANVTASGNPENPTISGTNGFELKRLPEIDINKKHSIITVQALSAYAIRTYMIKNISLESLIPIELNNKTKKDALMNRLKQELSEESCHGLYRYNELSDSIQVINTIQDDIDTHGNIVLNHNNELGKMQSTVDSLRKQFDELVVTFDSNPEEVQKQSDTKITTVLSNTDIKDFYKTLKLVESLKNTVDKNVYRTPVLTKVVKQDDINNLTFGEFVQIIREVTNLLKGVNKGVAIANALTGGLISAGAILGYKIRNIGKKDITITRINVSGVMDSSYRLNPGDTTCVSRAEAALNFSIPEIGFKLANGKIISRLIGKEQNNTNLWKRLSIPYFQFDNDIPVHSDAVTIPLTKAVSQDEIFRYYKIHEESSKLNVKLTDQDHIAYVIRTDFKTGLNQQLMNYSSRISDEEKRNNKPSIREEYENNKDLWHSSIENIKIVERIYSGAEFNTVGYTILNTGSTPIEIDRISCFYPYNISKVVLTQNQRITLSRVELNVLLSRIEYGGQVSNAKITSAIGAKSSNDIYGKISTYFITYDTQEEADAVHKVSFDTLSNKKELLNYIVVNNTKSESSSNANSAGIFNRFKR